MPAAAIVTLVLGALIVAAAALGLFRVIVHLSVIRQTLGTVVVGVQVIAHQTSTVEPVLTSVNANLAPVRDFCESI
jgi:multisubunit Na+/H+ antiporter MnhG subunit